MCVNTLDPAERSQRGKLGTVGLTRTTRGTRHYTTAHHDAVLYAFSLVLMALGLVWPDFQNVWRSLGIVAEFVRRALTHATLATCDAGALLSFLMAFAPDWAEFWHLVPCGPGGLNRGMSYADTPWNWELWVAWWIILQVQMLRSLLCSIPQRE
jgi:hypothetical protein